MSVEVTEMGRIADKILKLWNGNDLYVKELSPEESAIIRESTSIKYADGRKDWLWERMPNATKVHNPNGWQWIGEFIAGIEVVMFFNEREDQSVLRWKDSSLVNTALRETEGFEFYITNSDTQFLICFNQHDYLIASGSAKEWLDNKL
jgi:hypothetical protein